MLEFKKLPEDLDSLISLDRSIANQAKLWICDIDLKIKSPNLVRELVMCLAERTKGQAIIHALVKHHMSVVLRRCKLKSVAKEWEWEAFVVLSNREYFKEAVSPNTKKEPF
jgi:hypothetical protein